MINISKNVIIWWKAANTGTSSVDLGIQSIQFLLILLKTSNNTKSYTKAVEAVCWCVLLVLVKIIWTILFLGHLLLLVEHRLYKIVWIIRLNYSVRDVK